MRASLALVAVASLAAGSLSLAPQPQPERCDDAPYEPYPSATETGGSILFRVSNTQLATRIRLCVVDADGLRVYDVTRPVDAATVWEHRVLLPVGGYLAETQILTRSGGAASALHRPDLSACESRAVLAPTQAHEGPAGFGIASQSMECAEAAPPVPKGDVISPIPQVEAPDLGGKGEYPWVALGAVATGLVAFLAWPRSRYAILLLFSRVHGPAVLDQATRSEIYDLVRQDPGVTANRVSTVLGLGSGETRYHLGVLRRNQLLTEIRRGSLRCYFPSQFGSPDQLRATAVLRNAAAERLYDALLTRPGSSLTALADYAGLRLGTASKALQKLVDARLAERTATGREVNVRPTNLRPLAPMLESNPSSEPTPVS